VFLLYPFCSPLSSSLGPLDASYGRAVIGGEAHAKVVEKLDKIDKLDDIEETVESVDGKVDDLGEAIVVLHQDDEDVDEEALRRKVDVNEMSGDIVEGDD